MSVRARAHACVPCVRACTQACVFTELNRRRRRQLPGPPPPPCCLELPHQVYSYGLYSYGRYNNGRYSYGATTPLAHGGLLVCLCACAYAPLCVHGCVSARGRVRACVHACVRCVRVQTFFCLQGAGLLRCGWPHSAWEFSLSVAEVPVGKKKTDFLAVPSVGTNAPLPMKGRTCWAGCHGHFVFSIVCGQKHTRPRVCGGSGHFPPAHARSGGVCKIVLHAHNWAWRWVWRVPA